MTTKQTPLDAIRNCSEHGPVMHRYRPSPEAGPYWRCGECGEPATCSCENWVRESMVPDMAHHRDCEQNVAKQTPPDEEMVTISYEVTLHEAELMEGASPGRYTREAIAAAKAALDARKGKYELWKECIANRDETQPFTPEILMNLGTGEYRARLMAAAPELLEALIAVWREGAFPGKGHVAELLKEAIRAAVPTDVADYLLNEGTK